MIGELVHFSIPTANLENASKFYQTLFGWSFQRMTDTYWLIPGGVGSLSLEMESVSGTMPIMYFLVPSIDSSLQTATKVGGKVILKKTDAGDGKSFFATIQDLDGNVIGLWSKS